MCRVQSAGCGVRSEPDVEMWDVGCDGDVTRSAVVATPCHAMPRRRSPWAEEQVAPAAPYLQHGECARRLERHPSRPPAGDSQTGRQLHTGGA